MTALEIVAQVTSAGGCLTLTEDGNRIRAALPEDAHALLGLLRENRDEVLRLLRARADDAPGQDPCKTDPYRLAVHQAEQEGPQLIPRGIRLLEWQPKQPPVAITTWAVVNDVPQFIGATLTQLEAALRGDTWLAGNWSVRDLVERLEQVGVKVSVEVTR